MGKTGKSKMLKNEVDRRVKKIDKALPFQPSPRVLQPRSMKDRQQLWVLSGLKHLGAPLVLATMINMVFSIPHLQWDQPIDHVETFAGSMEVTKHEWMENRKAVPMDVTYNGQTMDLLTPLGFSNAVYHTLNLRPGAGALTAPVCSTFVVVSMGSTLRTKSNPLGRADSQAVRDGNLLCARALILMLIASAKGVFWCLEQPSSSTMEYHPVFQMLLRLVTVRRVIFKMSQFGGPTPKRTILYSSHRCVADIMAHTVPERLRPRQMVVRYLNKEGKVRFKGGSALKGSQSYPAPFGRALSKVRTSHQKRNFRLAQQFLRAAKRTQNDFDSRPTINNRWNKHGQLDSVIKFLSKP